MIYQYTLYPLVSILQTTFTILIDISGSYFLSIVLLAVLVRVLTKPLEKFANRAVKNETEMESVLQPQINGIKQKLTGARQHEAIKRLYARYSYHPVLAIRSLSGLLVQLPFFIAAYYMLKGFPPLKGVMVPVLGDLGKPDALLFGSIHLMPFVMTLVNVLALITAPFFSRKALIQGLFISLVFFFLLYSAPLGLLIYWTVSNLFSLISNFSPSITQKLNLGKSKIQFKDTSAGRGFEEYAYIFFVINLAFLVPLLGVLGDQFNFLTAHGLTRRFIIILFLCIALIPPMLLSLLRWPAKRTRFLKLFDGAVLLTFIGVFITYTINKVGYGLFPAEYEPSILFCLALIITTAAVWVILKKQLLRNLSYFSLIIPLVLLHFIFVSPASTLFKQHGGFDSSKIAGMNDTPVFLLIFDEFSGLTLQNGNGELDASRYPGFAELASQADYFPNALTASFSTEISVPSIVSGNLRTGDKIGLAPEENLVELFRSTAPINAYSYMLPADLMTLQDTKLDSFISDLLTLYLHILCHQDWIKGKIGVIPPAWENFGIFFKGKIESSPVAPLSTSNRLNKIDTWIDGIEWANSQFNFFHILFPHVPYTVTALGKITADDSLLGNKFRISNSKQLWMKNLKEGIGQPFSNFLAGDKANLNVVYHNYLKQSAYTDVIVKKFIDALKSNNLFKRSIIIITADHGVSYDQKGITTRAPVNGDSWKNNVSVPLFIKYPYQKKGGVHFSYATTLDISNTIMAALGIRSPWESVGQDLKALKDNTQTQSVKLIPGYETYFKDINNLFDKSRARKKTLFGESTPVHTIRVNYTENPKYSVLLDKEISDLTIGKASDIHAIYDGSLKPKENCYLGVVYRGNQPVNKKVIAVVEDNHIQAVFQSGKVREQNGFFSFSLPEKKRLPAEFNVSLFEVEGAKDFTFRKISTMDRNCVNLKRFQSKHQIPYDWKNSIHSSNELDELKISPKGIKIAYSKSIDPFVVFNPVSPKAISEPTFHINLESNRNLIMNLYYQTVHNQKFHKSQRLDYYLQRGKNSLYFNIPDKDFNGFFRIDIGSKVATEVLIQNIEIRTEG